MRNTGCCSGGSDRDALGSKSAGKSTPSGMKINFTYMSVSRSFRGGSAAAKSPKPSPPR
ncbi:Uncharacterised protein [Mycobacteroides abscessus subsp. abscessus]|nr:Uncharacterised protein [Mycobacteroides abscessus subsp. abscessus]